MGTTPSGSLRCSTGGVDDSRLEHLYAERLYDDGYANTVCLQSFAAQTLPPSLRDASPSCFRDSADDHGAYSALHTILPYGVLRLCVYTLRRLHVPAHLMVRHQQGQALATRAQVYVYVFEQHPYYVYSSASNNKDGRLLSRSAT